MLRLRSRTGGTSDTSASGSWAIYFGVAVDLFSDGVMIGAGSTLSPSLGVLLALGQVPADVPEGFATIATFKAQGMSRRRRLLLAASFAIPILLGATISYFGLRGQPEVYKLGLLAFTAGILLTVAVEEIVVEAHKEYDSRLASLRLIGGFALFIALGEFLEERSGVDAEEGRGADVASVAPPRRTSQPPTSVLSARMDWRAAALGNAPLATTCTSASSRLYKSLPKCSAPSRV